MLPLSSSRYKARCRDGDLVAVTFVDVGVPSGGLGLSLGPNKQIARVGGYYNFTGLITSKL